MTALFVLVVVVGVFWGAGIVRASSPGPPPPCSGTPVIVTAPVLSPIGWQVQTQLLSTTSGSWSDCFSPFTYSYQWYSSAGAPPGGARTAITGATSSTFTPDTLHHNAYVNDYLTVDVTACDSVDHCATTTSQDGSGHTGYVHLAPAPANTVLPSTSGSTVLSSGSPQLTGSDGTWTNDVTPTITRQWQRCGYDSTILSNSPAPLDYWRLGDATSAPTARDENDSIEAGNDGTYVGSPTFGTGALGSADSNQAVTLNGAGQYINLAKSVQFDSGSFSIEGWFKTTSTAEEAIWDSGNNGGNQDVEVRLYQGKIRFALENLAGTSVIVAPATLYNNGAWHYFAATRSVSGSSETDTLYVDGAQVGSSSGTALGDLDAAGAQSRIGNGAGLRDGWYFNGSIDEMAIYNSVLSSSQVTADYDAGTNVTNSCINIAGATGTTYPLQAADFGNKIRYAVTETNDDGSTTAYSALTSAVTDAAPPTPVLTPSGALSVPALTAIALQGAAADSGDLVDTQFEITSAGGCSLATPYYSGWQVATDTWIVPAGVLQSGCTYTFQAQARDLYQDTAWSGSTMFMPTLTNYGTRGYWPIWSHGPVSVNEGNGNLVLSLPTPSYPTSTGSLGFSLTYNSQDTTHSPGLAAGWLLSGGDGSINPPVKLIDHSVASPISPAAEVVWPDGSSSYYDRVGPSTDTGDVVYVGAPGDNNQVIESISGTTKTWTLVDGSGTTYTFGSEDPSTGFAYLQQAQAASTAAASSGNGLLTYTFSSTGTVGELQDLQYTNDTSGLTEDLHFTWGCTYPTGVTADLCVQFEVNGSAVSGQEWSYVGVAASGTTTQVYDQSQKVMQLDYTGNQVTGVQNADDLNPGSWDTSYNGSHELKLSYDGTGSTARVTCLIDGPIGGQVASSQPTCAGTSPASESTWSFVYTNTCPTLQAPAVTHTVAQGSAAGCTTVISPNQQPNTDVGHGVTVLYDSLGRPLEYYDARLGTGNQRVTLQQYNTANQLAWSEDAAGNPTDYTYDPVDNVLLTTTQPRPDGIHGSQARPVTTYRYDEQTIGTSANAGKPLTGLAGFYWTGTTMSGQPATRENDPAPTDGSATTFSLPTAAGWPASVSAPNSFSVRWSGDITVPSTGTYHFTSQTDGGVRVAIDDTSVIDGWSIPSGPSWGPNGSIYLTAGKHTLLFEYEHQSRTRSGTTVQPSVDLEWLCNPCSPTNVNHVAVPLSALAPAWENQTSTVSPAGRISFQHYLNPAAGLPDYSLAQVGSQNLITGYTYDNWGRQASKIMPDAYTSATLDSNTGDLTPNFGSNYQDWETDYTYYGDTATPSIPTDCGAGTAPSQLGLLESTTTPNGGLNAITTVYNAIGEPIATANGKGTSCLKYDGLPYGSVSEGRLTSQTPNGDQTNPTTYTYDPNGTRLTSNNSSGTVTNISDEAGRVIDTTDAYGAEAAYTYDPDGNLTERETAVGPLSSNTNYDTLYSYDNADELTQDTDPALDTYYFYYDTRGNLRGTQYPTSTPTFSWVDTNPDGWISDQYNRHGTISSSTTSAPADSNPLADFTYTYDQDGKKLSQSEQIGTNSPTSTTYSYDNAGRLNQVVLPSGTCRDYIYDLDSNRTAIQEYPSGVGCTGTLTTTASYTYDPTTTPGTDELTTVVAGGNTTNYGYTSDGQVASEGATNFTWDGFGRISTATVGSNTVTYTYDPTGSVMRRTSSSPSSTIQYLLGDLFETDGTGILTASYAEGPAGDLASFTGAPTGSPTFLYYDPHGNLVAEADTTGTETASHTYDPFGAPTDSVPANTTVHRFVGRWNKQYDTTTGLVLMGARPYDPNTGRFLAVDPVPGGSLNNYDYAGQDPINDYDLSGTMYGEGENWCQGATGAALRQCAYNHFPYAVYCAMYHDRSCHVGGGGWDPISACVRGAIPVGGLYSIYQGIASGVYEQGLTGEAAIKFGLRSFVSVKWLAVGCATNVLEHYLLGSMPSWRVAN